MEEERPQIEPKDSLEEENFTPEDDAQHRRMKAAKKVADAARTKLEARN